MIWLYLGLLVYNIFMVVLSEDFRVAVGHAQGVFGWLCTLMFYLQIHGY